MTTTSDLGDYLRVRRAALSPADVGLNAGGRRRTSGLRREEVAMLANVSVSWYTWLEQGRPIRASLDVLDSVARALRLDDVERDHVRSLAGYPLAGYADVAASKGPDQAISGAVPESIHQVLLSLEPCPAFVIGPTWDMLAWNRGMAKLSPLMDTFTPEELNLLWLVFANPQVIALIGDWENEARRILSQFRARTSPIRKAPAVVELVERLHQASPIFAELWQRHDVGGFESHVRTFHHPIAGMLRFGYQQLIPADVAHLRIVVHLRLPGDDSVDRLWACPPA